MDSKTESLLFNISKALKLYKITDAKYTHQKIQHHKCRLCNDTNIYHNVYCTHPILEDEICIECNNNRTYTTLLGSVVDCLHLLKYRRLLG